MRTHLYEFRSATRLLKCQCGWQKTLKSTNLELAYQAFALHKSQALSELSEN